jgi:formin-binding protein 1
MTCADLVRALYDYAAQGSDEISFQEGAVIKLSTGPNGGKNYADGWWEGSLLSSHLQSTKFNQHPTGFDSAGNKGIFPSNYVS